MRQLAERDGHGAFEELRVVDAQHRELRVVIDVLDARRVFLAVAGLQHLHVDLIADDVRVREDAPILQDARRAAGVRLIAVRPRLEVVGLFDRREDFDDRFAQRIALRGPHFFHWAEDIFGAPSISTSPHGPLRRMWARIASRDGASSRKTSSSWSARVCPSERAAISLLSESTTVGSRGPFGSVSGSAFSQSTGARETGTVSGTGPASSRNRRKRSKSCCASFVLFSSASASSLLSSRLSSSRKSCFKLASRIGATSNTKLLSSPSSKSR